MNTIFQNRKSKRQNVLLKSKIDVGSYYFDVITYDLSLRGAKIKLDIPLERGAKFNLTIKNNKVLPSKVSWSKDGFLGIEFNYPPETVKNIFGTLGDRLE
ncbi:MAG: PilZ domain-containing protein [Kordiimonadaceae bacterium]|nr:PilZ domain-containing protein [Kordiimonadaceae bacterium]MBT6031372.1 PilZ domain-containing protein [Kordiimonadaceae bacterium]